MIVKMKKLTLLVSEKDREDLLVRLRKLGIVHIKNVSKSASGELASAEAACAQVKNAISILSDHAVHSEAEKVSCGYSEALQCAGEVALLARDRDDSIKTAQDIEAGMSWFEPWGAFDPEDLSKLEEKGVFVELYRLTKKEFLKVRHRKDVRIIKEDKQYKYIAHLRTKESEEFVFDKIKLPKESFESLYARHETLKHKIDEIRNTLRIKARIADSLKGHLSTFEARQNFLSVMYGMKEEEGFSYLQGFCPVDKVQDIITLSKNRRLGYLMEEPDESMDVPTLIRNPKWINIISPVFKFMNTVPGYTEYDISLWFLLFFSLFFAMLVGDAGYGVLFTVITFLARRKFRKVPPEPFRLMYVLSFATIIWGAVTGTWFGVEKIAQLPFFNALVIERINSFVDGNQNFMIYMCFVIGAVHLSIAHFITAVKRINTLRALAEFGWISTIWGLFFTAGTLVLDKPFPKTGGYLLIAGVSLVLLFSNPQKNIIKGILTSLANIPLKIISSFADVVSYLRLFAVGYASVVLASTFNTLGGDVGFGNIISGIGAALIIFIGHTLNIVLALMAVIVHGVRLNMLEFSGQMGMEWSGKEYEPFREMNSV